MIRLLPIFALTLLLAAVPLASQRIPFDPFQGLVEVDVVVDGHAKGRFGIDTGADYLYIDRAFAAKNSLAVPEKPNMRGVVGIDGYSDAFRMDLRSLDLGSERLYNLEAVAIDMQALIKDERADPPDGLIGYHVLRRFYITVDYPTRTMILEQAEPDFLQSDNFATVPFTQRGHLILVDVTFNDSITVPMALDYCASFVYVSPALGARLKLPAEIERAQIGKVALGNNTIVTEDVYALTGDMSAIIGRMPGLQCEGLIGASFLFRHKITIDYKRSRIYLHPN